MCREQGGLSSQAPTKHLLSKPLEDLTAMAILSLALDYLFGSPMKGWIHPYGGVLPMGHLEDAISLKQVTALRASS